MGDRFWLIGDRWTSRWVEWFELSSSTDGKLLKQVQGDDQSTISMFTSTLTYHPSSTKHFTFHTLPFTVISW